MANEDLIKEVQRLFGNVTRISTEGVTKIIGPFVKDGFETFVKGLQGIVSPEIIESLMGLTDVIVTPLQAVLEPIITDILGVAKTPFGTSDEDVLKEASDVIQAVVMSGIVISVVAFLPELVHPLKELGLNRMSAMVMTMSGFDRIGATIMNILVERTMGAKLRYATNALMTPYIPNQQDLIRFTVREVLSPSELEMYMKKLGFSPAWSKHYWAAHWELVSVSSLYKLYHRGEIEERHLRKMLERHDYDANDKIFEGEYINWQEKLVELSHVLIPRVDLRYAWEAGLITDAEMGERMKKLGYSEQDAAIETVVQKRRTLTEEINAVRREVINDYKEGIITKNGFLANLSALGDTEVASNYRMEAAEYFQIRDHKKAMIREIEKALGRGDIEDEAAKDELVSLGVEEWRQLQIIEFAALKRKLKPDEVTYLETT